MKRILLLVFCILFVYSSVWAIPITLYIRGPIDDTTLPSLWWQYRTLYDSYTANSLVIDAITVVIISPGGQVYEAIAIYDYLVSLELQGIKVTTVASGYCASAATIILEAGDVREATAHTYLMVHSPLMMLQQGDILTKTNLRESEGALERCRQRIIGLFASRMHTNPARLDKYFQDTYWEPDPTTFMQLGFIDKVIYSAKEIVYLEKNK